MRYKQSNQNAHRELQIQKALNALQTKEFRSVCAAARQFEIPRQTLLDRRNGMNSRAQARETQQILTNAEEKTLVRWITRYTIAGTPATPSLVVELAQLLRIERVRHAPRQRVAAPQLDSIGNEWLYRFLNRHSEIKGIYARQLEHSRFSGATFEKVKRWFDAVAAQLQEHNYNPADIWNMDESGFGVGESQTTRVLIHMNSKQKYKVANGKQEWVTDIECISAAGEALPPMIIYKGKHMNSGWLSPDTPVDWHFAVSENGWTSNELGLQWLIKIFEPYTRVTAANRRRLLIADGHGSHIRADFIAYCMENSIDLLIMPPHCSHLLQPLDVGVFAAFKRAHGSETDSISRFSSQRIPRAEWIEMLTRARSKAVTKDNILSGWRGAGLMPSDPFRILNHLPSEATLIQDKPQTPPNSDKLDLALLKSSPPEAVELSKSNAKFAEALRGSNDVVSPVKRYAERMTRMCETQNATIALMAKQLAEQSTLLHTRKARTRGKRVKLDGVSVYSTPEVLRIAREAETKTPINRPRGRPRKRAIEEVEEEVEDELLESSSSDAEVELGQSVAGRTRSKA